MALQADVWHYVFKGGDEVLPTVLALHDVDVVAAGTKDIGDLAEVAAVGGAGVEADDLVDEELPHGEGHEIGFGDFEEGAVQGFGVVAGSNGV